MAKAETAGSERAAGKGGGEEKGRKEMRFEPEKKSQR